MAAPCRLWRPPASFVSPAVCVCMRAWSACMHARRSIIHACLQAVYEGVPVYHACRARTAADQPIGRPSVFADGAGEHRRAQMSKSPMAPWRIRGDRSDGLPAAVEVRHPGPSEMTAHPSVPPPPPAVEPGFASPTKSLTHYSQSNPPPPVHTCTYVRARAHAYPVRVLECPGCIQCGASRCRAVPCGLVPCRACVPCILSCPACMRIL